MPPETGSDRFPHIAQLMDTLRHTPSHPFGVALETELRALVPDVPQVELPVFPQDPAHDAAAFVIVIGPGGRRRCPPCHRPI